MKLYMREKVFSWRNRFYIKDEQGQDRYYVEGELFTLGKKLHIYDMSGFEVAFVQEKFFSFLHRFYVLMEGRQVAEIVKEFTFLKPKYSISGPGWEVEGSFWEHDYSIFGGGGRVADIHKVWMSWGDSYEIDFGQTGDEVLVLAVVLAIDAVMEDTAHAAAASANS